MARASALLLLLLLINQQRIGSATDFFHSSLGSKLFGSQSLRLAQALRRQVDRFRPPVRIRDVALLVKRIHHGEVLSLPDSAILEFKCTKQGKDRLLQLRIVVFQVAPWYACTALAQLQGTASFSLNVLSIEGLAIGQRIGG